MREPQIGGLHLPKDSGISSTEAQAIEQWWNTIDAVDAQMHALGLGSNPAPDIECPVVTTERLVTTDIKEYTTLFSSQLRWYNYVDRLHARLCALLLQTDNEMDDIAVHKRTHFRQLNEGRGKSERMTAAEMDDTIQVDPHYRDLKLQRQLLEQQRLQLKSWAEGLDRNLRAVSRQIENRRAEGMNGAREGNMAAHANGRWEPRLR